MNQQQSFKRLTVYFALFATIAAGMIGLGQLSWNLPLLVGFCSLVSVIYTDTLGWFSLHRWLVYVGMIAGAAIAIFNFLGDASANQIIAVGNLLVYVQIPLMFQKKSKRVYEQWGVFLLLELVVAALVNDNVLYGVMMLPVLAIGCAALMALAQFASYLRHSESIAESRSTWSRMLLWLGKEQMVSKRSSGVTLSAIPTGVSTVAAPPRFAPARWFRGILPIATAVLMFAVAYFYSLPRLNSSSYEGDGWGSPQIGFSDQISLRQVGEMLQNDTPVFRMSMKDNKTGRNYRPNLPPYIRMSIAHRYFDGPSKGIWDRGESGFFIDARVMRKLPNGTEIHEALASEADSVSVSFVEKSSLGSVVPSLAPNSVDTPIKEFQVVRKDWRIIDTRESSRTINRKRRYTYNTYAFTNGQDSAVLPDLYDCLRDEDNYSSSVPFAGYNSRELLDFPVSLSSILPLRDRVLSAASQTEQDKLSQAILLEDYLANGPDFSYTLSLTGPVNRDFDPIVDFLLNKRKGHCQYFASSLALLLRSLDIPSRIVIGFRPSEYNELGQYFLVQQNHAHAWVEAYFTLEDLKLRFPKLPSWVTKGAWLRLDPTPPGDGSNAGGTLRRSNGETLDVMQDLWTEMVLNMDKSKQSSILSLFGESSEGSYSSVWLQMQALVMRMQSSRFIGGFLSPEKWFSWRQALGIIIVGSVGVVAYRFLLWMFPNWMPRIRWRSSAKSRASSVDFYNRAIRSLKRLGIQRNRHETQREFFSNAKAKLSGQEIPLDADLLSRLFYECRFGGVEKLSESDQKRVDESIQELESKAGYWNRRRPADIH